VIGTIFEAFGDYVKNRCSPAANAQVAKVLAGVRLLATSEYPDQLVRDAVASVARTELKPGNDVLEAFGEHFIDWAKPRYRMAFAAPSARDFLLRMDVVHQSVRNLAKAAKPPEFVYEKPAPDRLVMIYRSPRKLCPVMRGLYKGLGAAFGEKILVNETTCMLKGAHECRFELTFMKK
jgi:hypothetical protein